MTKDRYRRFFLLPMMMMMMMMMMTIMMMMFAHSRHLAYPTFQFENKKKT